MISSRNVFRLGKPKIERPVEAKRELPSVTLQGLSGLQDHPQVLLKIQAGATPSTIDVSCVLNEGQELGGVRVVRIDMISQTVLLNNNGVEKVLASGR